MKIKNAVQTKFFLPLLVLASCSQSGTNLSTIGSDVEFKRNDAYPSQGSNFRVSLVDAPKDIKEVIVNIDHVEMKLSNSEKSGRIRFANGLGQIDLLKLQNGVSLPLIDLDIPDGVAVSEIRLHLKVDGNYITKNDDSHCDLQTPSGQQSGLKLKMSAPSLVEDGFAYSLVVDFDAEKSIVIKGNGDCLLKPVLKIKSFARIEVPEIPVVLPEEPGEDEVAIEPPVDPIPVTDPAPVEESLPADSTTDSSQDPATEPSTEPAPVDQTPIDDTPYIDDFATGGIVDYFQ